MRFSYLSSRSTVSVMEKEEEEKRQRIPCCLTTTTSRIFFKIKSCTERKGKRKRLVFLSLLSTYSRHIYMAGVRGQKREEDKSFSLSLSLCATFDFEEDA